MLIMELAMEATPDDMQKKELSVKIFQALSNKDREVNLNKPGTDSEKMENKKAIERLKEANSLFAYITDEEMSVLTEVKDPSSIIWIWVACMLGNLAASGDVPPMPTPTYGSLMQNVRSATQAIRKVRSSISIQPPYIYVQMLAALVHLNNIINAVAFG